MPPKEIEEKVYEITGLKMTDKKQKEFDFIKWRDINKSMDVFEIGSHTLTHPILTNISILEYFLKRI